MGKCELCEKEIDSKYKFCVACNQKMKDDQKDKGLSDSGEIVKALGAINNNLYFLRTATAIILKKQFKTEINWNVESKSFTEKKAKK